MNLQIDMTNTGSFEDGWLLIDTVSNDLGRPDRTEFTINAYDENGNDLGSKKFDFEELFKYGKPVSSSKKIQSSLKEELEKQMKERHLKLNPDGETPDLSAAVEYIEQNDDWYIGTDEQKARKWIRDTLENSDDLITSSMIKDKIQSSAIGKKLRKADKFSGGRGVDLAFNSDSFADFKRHLAKAVDKANQNGSRMFRDKWEDIEFTESELKYLFNGPDGYNLPTSTERTLSPEEKKQRKQWQDDFAYGETVHSIGYNED